jgi:hypothetical protein
MRTLSKFLNPSIDHFVDQQRHAAFSMVEKVAFCDGQPNIKQAELLEQLKEVLTPKNANFKAW